MEVFGLGVVAVFDRGSSEAVLFEAPGDVRGLADVDGAPREVEQDVDAGLIEEAVEGGFAGPALPARRDGEPVD